MGTIFAILGFLRKYWMQIAAVIAILAVLGSIYGLYESNLSLAAKAAVAEQDKKTAIYDYNQLRDADKALEQSVADLEKRNAGLKADIETSKTKIAGLSASQKALLAKLAAQVLPADCAGKIQWLRNEAQDMKQSVTVGAPAEVNPLDKIQNSLHDLTGGH